MTTVGGAFVTRTNPSTLEGPEKRNLFRISLQCPATGTAACFRYEEMRSATDL